MSLLCCWIAFGWIARIKSRFAGVDRTAFEETPTKTGSPS